VQLVSEVFYSICVPPLCQKWESTKIFFCSLHSHLFCPPTFNSVVPPLHSKHTCVRPTQFLIPHKKTQLRAIHVQSSKTISRGIGGPPLKAKGRGGNRKGMKEWGRGKALWTVKRNKGTRSMRRYGMVSEGTGENGREKYGPESIASCSHRWTPL